MHVRDISVASDHGRPLGSFQKGISVMLRACVEFIRKVLVLIACHLYKTRVRDFGFVCEYVRSQ